MVQYIDKSALVAEIDRRIKEISKEFQESKNIQYTLLGKINALENLLPFLDTLEVKEKNEGVESNDLEEAAWAYYDKNKPLIPHELDLHKEMINFFIAGAQWQKENLWKDAQGNDLPEIDREVIVLYQPYPCEGNEYAVSFAHRPPERWYGRNLDGEEHIFEPKTYDKGEWNIPNVVWWLDLDLPIKGE